jgi:hypothetical protein
MRNRIDCIRLLSPARHFILPSSLQLELAESRISLAGSLHLKNLLIFPLVRNKSFQTGTKKGKKLKATETVQKRHNKECLTEVESPRRV